MVILINPLFDAYSSDNEKLVKYLIEIGTDINEEDSDDGKTTNILCIGR